MEHSYGLLRYFCCFPYSTAEQRLYSNIFLPKASLVASAIIALQLRSTPPSKPCNPGLDQPKEEVASIQGYIPSFNLPKLLLLDYSTLAVCLFRHVQTPQAIACVSLTVYPMVAWYVPWGVRVRRMGASAAYNAWVYTEHLSCS